MIDLYLPEKLQRRIVEKYERCEELDARATGYGSPSEFKERVRTSSPQDGGFEMLILRKVVIEKEIAALQDKQRDALKAILDVAGTMQDENLSHLIIRRHVDLWPNKWIAEEQERTVRTIQRRLIDARKMFREAEQGFCK